MTIVVLSMWHNEETIAPFFLSHYAYADKIHLIIGGDTTDNTREICARYPNVEIDAFDMPGGLLNDALKIRKINDMASNLDCDWIMAVDADELLFPANGESASAILARQSANLLYAQMWQVYRHETEGELNPGLPAIYQRRHGDPDITTHPNSDYVKPIIVRPEVKIEWGPGCHLYRANGKIRVSADSFLGAHWQMADVNMAIDRRVQGRRKRFSEENLRMGWGGQHFTITEDEIKAECAAHAHDPQLF